LGERQPMREAQLDFHRHSGRREAVISDAQLRIGESRDSGFVLRTPRNDGGVCGMTAVFGSRYH
jgi:hypothetical protein